MNIDIKEIIKIAIEAGNKIMDIYENEDFSKTIDFKADDSPLTIADKAAHIIIEKGLLNLETVLPILSEEGKIASYDERKNWNLYWCVDPLDGTKEFINKNGQFTVNIALISGSTPILGVVYAPAIDTLYCGSVADGAYITKDGTTSKITVNRKNTERIAVKSKSHSSEAEDIVLADFNVTDTISVGSSLKFCMVAEGKADIYFRNGPTMEWDTAAGQAVVTAAGGIVEDMNKTPFAYNKENLLNGSFICKGF